ncbi:hypothetical protein [Geothrix sp.]|jgi:hypothetical protein|uniref:hypothetical protein n=1 Tax=Geothrix sp. TaxID=1962974 RepID=UPI0025C378CE|nr:hypothetical protein [Geothrix sp.]
MSKPLSRLLRLEQTAFLARDRTAWGPHLARVRGFLGEGLQAADPARPVLILGAGSGLEVPWGLAPTGTTGWDADPWSRARTALRHRRWAPWVFEDLTGGLGDLAAAARRAVAEPWSGRHRDPQTAALRLAGLVPFLRPDPAALRAWIEVHRPGTILAANVMGQFGAVAERVVEGAFGKASPWAADAERSDPLAEALEAWTRRALEAFLETLAGSGAALWLVHDRGVAFGPGSLELGPWTDPWMAQLRGGVEGLEVSDPLMGLDVGAALRAAGRDPHRRDRWVWPLAPDQRHVVEALASLPTGA